MSAQVQMNDYWSRRAPDYDAAQQRRDRVADDHKAWAQVWQQVLPSAPVDVLDVGTGSAFAACTIAGLGHRVVGIDLSEGMLAIAQEHAAEMTNPPQIQTGDAVDPPFASASFDAIVGRFVLWTLRDPAIAIANWRRLLRPDGLVAMVDSTWFPRGVPTGDQDATRISESYDDRVLAELPLATSTSIQESAHQLTAAGLRDVEVRPLRGILALDEKYGVTPNHQVQMKYIVTGRV